MDLKGQKTTSKDLLSCGNGAGLSEKLLLKPKAASSLRTERVPRSSVLERLHGFLPRLAQENQRLKQQMEREPHGRFDIEDVEGAEKVIQMDVSLFELSGSSSSSSSSEEDDDDAETSDSEDDDLEVTERNLKLPGARGNKGKAEIQVLEEPR